MSARLLAWTIRRARFCGPPGEVLGTLIAPTITAAAEAGSRLFSGGLHIEQRDSTDRLERALRKLEAQNAKDRRRRRRIARFHTEAPDDAA